MTNLENEIVNEMFITYNEIFKGAIRGFIHGSYAPVAFPASMRHWIDTHNSRSYSDDLSVFSQQFYHLLLGISAISFAATQVAEQEHGMWYAGALAATNLANCLRYGYEYYKKTRPREEVF